MKEVLINPAGVDWGNLGKVPRSSSVEKWGVAWESENSRGQSRLHLTWIKKGTGVHRKCGEKQTSREKFKIKNVSKIQFHLEKTHPLNKDQKWTELSTVRNSYIESFLLCSCFDPGQSYDRLNFPPGNLWTTVVGKSGKNVKLWVKSHKSLCPCN